MPERKDKYFVPLPRNQELQEILFGGAATRHLRNKSVTDAKIESLEAQKIRVGGEAPGLAVRMPEGGVLFHFDQGLSSTRGVRPLPGYVATLRPGEGRFGGAVAVETQLAYAVGASGKYTIRVHRAEATLRDYADMTLRELDDM